MKTSFMFSNIDEFTCQELKVTLQLQKKACLFFSQETSCLALSTLKKFDLGIAVG